MIRSQWSKISEWPQRLAHKIENLNPDLARNVLSYASQMVQPQLLASQFLLEEWGDTRVGVTISSRLRGLAGVLAAAEFMTQTLLRRHIQLAPENMSLTAAKIDLPMSIDVNLKLRLELSSADREEWLNELLRAGQAERELRVDIFDSLDLRRGQVELRIVLRHIAALPLPPTQS